MSNFSFLFPQKRDCTHKHALEAVQVIGSFSFLCKFLDANFLLFQSHCYFFYGKQAKVHPWTWERICQDVVKIKRFLESKGREI